MDTEAVIDAASYVVDRLEADAAYGEVCGVERTHTFVVADADGATTATDITETGVWWRAFEDGAADYRYTTSLDEDHLDDLLERSLRATRQLNQPEPARYDTGTSHRGTHPGWSAEDVRGCDAGEVASAVTSALVDAGADAFERVRVQYRDEHVETSLLTTTGSTLRTTLDRAGAETTLSDGVTLDGHVGGTDGLRTLERLPDHVDALSERVREAASADAAASTPEGDVDVVLSARAAGHLVHQLSHFFEADTRALGATPFDVGDRIGPSSLTVADVVRPGSWAGLAYDAEGRPTQPTSLVVDGVVRNVLHNTVSALDAGGHPTGNAIPSIGFEHAPRVHARHLDVESGDGVDRAGADLLVERVGSPRLANEATRTKRQSVLPPNVHYAKHIRDRTPADQDETDQRICLPVELGWTLDDGEPAGRVTAAELVVRPRDLLGARLGVRRETVTGTCHKHKSVLPFAVTAPSLRVETAVRTPR